MLLHLSSSSYGGERGGSALQTLHQEIKQEGEMVDFTVLLKVNLKDIFFKRYQMHY